jgi:hypothetical protein
MWPYDASMKTAFISFQVRLQNLEFWLTSKDTTNLPNFTEIQREQTVHCLDLIHRCDNPRQQWLCITQLLVFILWKCEVNAQKSLGIMTYVLCSEAPTQLRELSILEQPCNTGTRYLTLSSTPTYVICYTWLIMCLTYYTQLNWTNQHKLLPISDLLDKYKNITI